MSTPFSYGYLMATPTGIHSMKPRMSTSFNPYWLEPGAVVPVNIETTAALLGEIKAMLQAIRDPENHPSQFGTVTLERMEREIAAEREACAEKTGEFARKWWSIHCASNKHMETTRKAHDDFCALQAAIRARGQT